MIRRKQAGGSEGGYALIFVMVVLVIMWLMIPPVLKISFSGVRGAQIGEQRESRLHAADAGIEDAVYRIDRGLEGSASETSYALPQQLNGCVVDVNISPLPDAAYRVDSRATGVGGIVTSIESFVVDVDYVFLTDYAVVANGSVGMQPGTEVQGDVRYLYDGPLPDPNIKGVIDGDVTMDSPVFNWPQASRTAAYYWDDVEGLTPRASYKIDGNMDKIGPMYLYDGGDLVRITSGKSKQGILEGTVYVRGDLRIDLSDESVIDLNGQAIFVEGDITMQPGTPLLGPGCIIATGDIAFQPNQMNTGFILVVSLEGTVNAQPGGNFYGTLAGRDGVFLQPGGDVINPGTPPEYLNFPGLDGADPEVAIATYTIKP